MTSHQPQSDRWLYSRRRHLPGQLDRARRRVAQLEREAQRLGMTDLIGEREG